MVRKTIPAIAYLRTSSAANVGSDKDSDKRQPAAIAAFAKAPGYCIVDEFYDAAVSGADRWPSRASRPRSSGLPAAAGGRGSGSLRLCSEGAGGGRAGARATRAAPVAAADIKDTRGAWAPHWRRQALHCDCGAEDAARRIERQVAAAPAATCKSTLSTTSRWK